MKANSTYDFVIVGGGSAGSVVASRLSENTEFTVLLIEAGSNNTSPLVKVPAGAVGLVPTRYKNWHYFTTPQTGLNMRKGYQPRGKVLGGSSAINAMIYTRGHTNDYDDWDALGWGWNHVLPYFKKAEHNEYFNNDRHGQGGPLNVASSRSMHPVADAFVNSATKLDIPYNADFNSDVQEGVGRYQVTQKNGERCSAATGYLPEAVRQRDNLTILTDAQVHKILIKDKHCCGVKYVAKGNAHTVFANKEVLLCAGAINSPQMLMLSGIGNKQHLAEHGIACVHHLPGVGQNLQDHPDYVSTFRSNTSTLFGLSLKGLTHLASQAILYIKCRKGLLTSNFAETGGFIKTSTSLDRPDIQFHFVIARVKDHARHWRHALQHGFTIHTCVLRPKSVGAITLVSSDPTQPPNIDPNFLGHPDDLQTLKKGVKIASLIAASAPLSDYIESTDHKEHLMSDDELASHLRNTVDTVYHPIGTCKMGTDAMSVVDPELNVHGVTGLRVVDASIFPNLVGGNTNAPTIMVAERASDWIKQSYR